LHVASWQGGLFVRIQIPWLVCLLVLVIGSFVAFSLTQGQERPPHNAPASSPIQSAEQTPELTDDGSRLAAMMAKLLPLQRQMLLSAERGADWLRRSNRSDGKFIYGYLPDLRIPLPGDHYLRQVESACALARVSRYLGEERYAAVARQAILTLLLDTTLDGPEPQVRHTTLPPLAVNRIGAAGLLVLAIHELPAPGADLLEQAEQLCGYLHQQQLADGSFDLTGGMKDIQVEPDAILLYPGQAVTGLLHSYFARPAPWKVESMTKALAYYRNWWRAQKNLAMVPWLSAAFTEAYFLSKEQAFADAVYEMNDWLCGLQYAQLDPNHPLWTGGFMDWIDGRPMPSFPTISSACYSSSLAEGCRVAHQLMDLPRYKRYREALERSLQYLCTLQYTEANTQHFADWYRSMLLGGFHASQQDGNLRIDYTAQAVSAMAQYLELGSGKW
jgi:hypothetical protein